ncbi:MAG: glycosyltransferase [Bacteroidota bacterium]
MILLKEALRVLIEEGIGSFYRKSVRYGKLKFHGILFKLKMLARKRKAVIFPYDAMMMPEVNEGKNIAFTIGTKNHLHRSLTLRDSFLKHNPDWKFVIFISDMLQSNDEMIYCKNLIEKGVDIIFVHALKNRIRIDTLEEMFFKYTVFEMSTSLKPFLLEYFLQQGCERVIYFDSDIYCLNSIEQVTALLDNYDIILTPHILKPYDDDRNPDEIKILLSGSFNLGFIAVRNSGETLQFCRWWQQRLFKHCFMDVHNGIHADQKWIDLIPSFFNNYYILKNPGYNVAYWNLHERKIRQERGTWYVNDEKLVLFHFSGLDINDPFAISIHQNRYTLYDVPSLDPLFEEYREEIFKHGYDIDRNWKYYFDYLPTTTIRIPDSVRRLFYKEVLQETKNPYTPDAEILNKTINSLTREVESGSGINRIAYSLWNTRNDLRQTYPNLSDRNEQQRFRDWYLGSAYRENHIDKIFIREDPDVKEIAPPNNGMPGINIIGYFPYDFGNAITTRIFVKKVYETGIPFTLFPLQTGEHALINPEEQAEFKMYYAQQPLFKKNIFFVNADIIKFVRRNYPALFKGKQNSAVWWWEFENDFPFSDSFQYIDEVIVFSDFVYSAIAKYAPPHVSVNKMRYPFIQDWKIVTSPHRVREALGFSDDNFIFIFNFDFLSSYERKNPEAVVRAFAQACRERKEARLIIKTLHGYAFPERYAQLKKCIANSTISNQIVLIEDIFPRNEFMNLMNAVDCYVSLHRSEGFGLGMFEAMVMGKPVIATAYGGNCEYMHDTHSLLVDYELTTSKDTLFDVYQKGWVWAEPKISPAVEYMHELCVNPSRAREIGKRGKVFADAFCSSATFSNDFYNYVGR